MLSSAGKTHPPCVGCGERERTRLHARVGRERFTMERTSSPRTRLHARVEHGGIGQRSPVTVELDPLDLAGRRRALPHRATPPGFLEFPDPYARTRDDGC